MQYLAYLEEKVDLQDRWLLMQNLALGPTRRRILEALSILPGQHVLDLGCGFGVLAIDLAARVPVKVAAIDVSPVKVECATQISQSVRDATGSLHGDISFLVDNGYELSFDDSTFDWVISQHVFQHLTHPTAVMSEIFRVLKPGGRVCVIDVDDGLGVSYPEQASFTKLGELLVQVQEHRGGDRQIGRKLPYLLHSAGFMVESTIPVVSAQFLSAEAKVPALGVIKQHLLAIRQDAVEHGFVTESEFDTLLDDFLHHQLPFALETDVSFAVTARRPPIG